MHGLDALHIKIFADGADKDGMLSLYRNPLIKGLTTNPTLMRKAGIIEYESFCREVLEIVPDRPISFEVFADETDDIERQARKIASWGDNVFVKIPVMTTDGVATTALVAHLAAEGVQQNVTALLTVRQVGLVLPALENGPDAFISLFAGRIADSGRDPIPAVRASVALLEGHSNLRLIWASPREVLNIVQAAEVGCHVITVTSDLLAKLGSLGKDLEQFSLETVQMFSNDAIASGFSL